MTESQKKLMPYVESKVEGILTSKEDDIVRPLIATESEIVYGIREDVIECMRELYRQKRYIPCNTLNHPALMRM